MFKKIIIILVLVAAIGIAIVYSSNKGSGISSLTSTGVTPSDTLAGNPNAVSADFLSQLLALQSITLDTSVLQNPAFGKLTDNTVVLVDPEMKEGRIHLRLLRAPRP